MYPIYKDFQEKARSDESQNKKFEEDNNEFDKLLKEIIHN